MPALMEKYLLFRFCLRQLKIANSCSYNDGNRGFKDWKEEEERKLYDFLDKANDKNIKFALSNVMEHKGTENKILEKWSKKYKTIYLENDYSNSSYNTKKGKSKEVLIINY